MATLDLLTLAFSAHMISWQTSLSYIPIDYTEYGALVNRRVSVLALNQGSSSF
jgi:hypothetical protein